MHQLDPLVREVATEASEAKKLASGSLPNLFCNEPLENQLGPHGWCSSFTNEKQGLRLASYFWPSLVEPATRPRGVVVLLHGHGAYLLEYLRPQVSLCAVGHKVPPLVAPPSHCSGTLSSQRVDGRVTQSMS